LTGDESSVLYHLLAVKHNRQIKEKKENDLKLLAESK
jgi:hypothetical protein